MLTNRRSFHETTEGMNPRFIRRRHGVDTKLLSQIKFPYQFRFTCPLLQRSHVQTDDLDAIGEEVEAVAFGQRAGVEAGVRRIFVPIESGGGICQRNRPSRSRKHMRTAASPLIFGSRPGVVGAGPHEPVGDHRRSETVRAEFRLPLDVACRLHTGDRAARKAGCSCRDSRNCGSCRGRAWASRRPAEEEARPQATLPRRRGKRHTRGLQYGQRELTTGDTRQGG